MAATVAHAGGHHGAPASSAGAVHPLVARARSAGASSSIIERCFGTLVAGYGVEGAGFLLEENVGVDFMAEVQRQGDLDGEGGPSAYGRGGEDAASGRAASGPVSRLPQPPPPPPSSSGHYQAPRGQQQLFPPSVRDPMTLPAASSVSWLRNFCCYPELPIPLSLLPSPPDRTTALAGGRGHRGRQPAHIRQRRLQAEAARGEVADLFFFVLCEDGFAPTPHVKGEVGGPLHSTLIPSGSARMRLVYPPPPFSSLPI